jgi:hypothetical protein
VIQQAAEGALLFDQFAEAVGDLTDVSARRVGAAPRDSQWRSQSRNVLANMDTSMKEVLYASGWTALDTNSFCLIGLLPRMHHSDQHELFSGDAPYLAAIGGLASGPVGGGR